MYEFFYIRSHGSKLDNSKSNQWCVWERCWRISTIC